MAKDLPFPIRTSTSCLLKWAWSTLWLNRGKVSSCHRNFKIDVPLDDFDNFHNQPYYVDHRESMLRGEWPNSPDHLGCGYCRLIEEAGGRSDRQYMTETKTDQTPDELEDNPTATHITPTILEVFINNKCNLACTYCNVNDSSVHETEVQRFFNPEFNERYFGRTEINVSDEVCNQYVEKLISWLQRKGSAVQRLQLLGGEPFIQTDFYKIVDVFKDYPNPNLELNVITNMNLPHKMFIKHVGFLQQLVKDKKVKRIDITASVDCWGDSIEYVRRGFSMDLFEKNMLYILQYPNEIRVNINSTHNLMSLDTYSDLLVKKKEWQDLTGGKIGMFGQIVGSYQVDPRTLGGDFFKETFVRIRKNLPLQTWDDRQAAKAMHGIMKNIEQSKPDLQRISDFLTCYNELDRRYGTDWKKTFPRIAEAMSKYEDTE